MLELDLHIILQRMIAVLFIFLIGFVCANLTEFEEYELLSFCSNAFIKKEESNFFLEDSSINSFLRLFENEEELDYLLLDQNWWDTVKDGTSTAVNGMVDKTTSFFAQKGDSIQRTLGKAKDFTKFAKKTSLMVGGFGVLAAPFTGGASLAITAQAVGALQVTKQFSKVIKNTQRATKVVTEASKGYRAGGYREGIQKGGMEVFKIGKKMAVKTLFGQTFETIGAKGGADNLSNGMNSGLSKTLGDGLTRYAEPTKKIVKVLTQKTAKQVVKPVVKPAIERKINKMF